MVTDVLDPDALSWTNHHRSLSFMCFRFVLNYVSWSYIFRRASSYISLDFVVIAFIITVCSWFAVSLVDAFFNVLNRFMETFCLEINIDRLLLETACYSNHCNRKVWRMKSSDNSRHFSAYSNWVQFSAYQISFWIDNLVADFIEEANTVVRAENATPSYSCVTRINASRITAEVWGARHISKTRQLRLLPSSPRWSRCMNPDYSLLL